MAYPLIILGAGASHDCLRRDEYPSDQLDLDLWIPPISNKLFDGSKFHALLTKYEEMDKLVGYIKAKLRATTPKTFEEILSKLYFDKIKNDPDLYKSFISLLFYLSDLFSQITQKYYRPHNNYDALLKIISISVNRAIFINFNYDLFLEKSLEKDKIKHVDELISGNLPIIKVHGSCNWYWSRLVNSWGDENKSSYRLSMNVASALINPGDAKKNWNLIIHNSTDPKHIASHGADFTTAYSLHPALALPILEKDNFVCPLSHIEFLKSQFKQVDRIIIIGWKIGDPLVKNLILEELKIRPIPIAFVGGKNSKNIVTNLEKEFQKNITLINSMGFSDFVASDEGENFFN